MTKGMICIQVAVLLAMLGAGCEDTIDCERCREWSIVRVDERVTGSVEEPTFCLIHEAEGSSNTKLGLQLSAIKQPEACVDVVLWAGDRLDAKRAGTNDTQEATFSFGQAQQKNRSGVTVVMLRDSGGTSLRSRKEACDVAGMMLASDIVEVHFRLEGGIERQDTFAMFGLRNAVLTACNKLGNCPGTLVQHL